VACWTWNALELIRLLARAHAFYRLELDVLSVSDDLYSGWDLFRLSYYFTKEHTLKIPKSSWDFHGSSIHKINSIPKSKRNDWDGSYTRDKAIPHHSHSHSSSRGWFLRLVNKLHSLVAIDSSINNLH
jgi:hypothetical protein